MKAAFYAIILTISLAMNIGQALVNYSLNARSAVLEFQVIQKDQIIDELTKYILLLNPTIANKDAKDYSRHIVTYSSKYNIDPYVLTKLLWAESNINPRAV